MSSGTNQSISYILKDKASHGWVMVQAGAGAGKTTELVRRVLSFGYFHFQEYRRWPRLVVTTFTVKATAEVRERLIQSSLKEWKNARLSEEMFSALLQWILSDALWITTLDGLFLRVVRSWAGLQGIPDDFEITTEEGEIYSRFLKSVYFESDSLRFLVESLIDNYGFSSVLPFLQSSLRAYATRGEWRSRDEKFEKQWHLERLLQLASQLRQSVEELTLQLDKKNKDKMQKWNTLLDTLPSVSSSLEDWVIWLEQVKASKFRASSPLGKDPSDHLKILWWHIKQIYDDLKKFIEALPEESLWQQAIQMQTQWSEQLPHLFAEWIQFLKREKKIPLSFIESMAYWILSVNDGSKASEENVFESSLAHSIVTLFSQEWDYWYFDEYQDTSPSQDQLLTLLMGNKPGFFVGDPQQSIYGFRGSKHEIFFERWRQVQERGGELIKLDVNRRSRPGLIQRINQATSLLNRVSSSADFFPMRSAEEPEALSNPAIEKRSDGWMEVRQYVYQKIRGLRIQDVKKLWLKQMLSCELPRFTMKDNSFHWGRLTILSHYNAELEIIAQVLREMCIPFVLESGGDFYAREEIAYAGQLMRFMLNPEDDENLFELLCHPVWGLNPKSLEGWKKAKSHEQSLWQYVQAQSVLSEERLQWLKAFIGLDLDPFFWKWFEFLQGSGIFEYYKSTDFSGVAEANLWRLVQQTFERQLQPGFSWPDYYTYLLRQRVLGSGVKESVPEPKEHQVVRLMTVHASKGLEFDYVLYPYLSKTMAQDLDIFYAEEEGYFTLKIPESSFCPRVKELRRSDTQASWQEQKRWFYVAITRAKRGLLIPYLREERSENEEQNPSESKENQKEHLLEVLEDLVDETVTLDVTLGNESVGTTMTSDILKRPWLPEWSLIPGKASKMLNDKNPEEKSLSLEPLSLDKWVAQFQGVRLHRHLELAVTKAKYGLAAKHSLPPWLSWLAEKYPQLVHSFQEAFPEWAYTIREEASGEIRQGRIDLWGYFPSGGAWILDYKTGRHTQEDVAWLQLETYARDLVRLGYVDPKMPIQLYLVLLAQQEVRERLYR